MEQVSRRAVLKGGSALAVFGGLGVGGLLSARDGGGDQAAAATTSYSTSGSWNWSSTGSIPGVGTGADPRWVWDPEADDLVASLMQRGLVPQVNQLLAGWNSNFQPAPAGLPSDVKAFIAKARQLPSWADPQKLAVGAAFNQKQAWVISTAYAFASGMMSTVIPHEARAVYYSAGGANMQDRITKTALLGYDIGRPDAFGPTGAQIVTCVKTRMTHAGVRNLLPQSPAWKATADETKPISQRDMMVTWHSLATTVAATLGKWKVPVTDAESAGYLHTWQVTAHMLGIHDEYIPGSWATAKSQADQVLTPILAPTSEGIKLADDLLHLASGIDGGILSYPVMCALSRYVLGDQITTWLQVPKQPFWDPVFALFWPPFVAVREGLLKTFPGTGDIYAVFDTIVEIGVLAYLSRLNFPIDIKIPTGNNPTIP
jgi:hypothetical protein